MTMVGSFFGAKETAVVKVGYVVARVDGSFVHQAIENPFVLLPRNFVGTVVTQQFFCRRKIRDVTVTDATYLLEEIRQIGAFRKPSQLATITDAHIHQRPHMMRLEQLKKLLSTLLCEAYGKQRNHHKLSRISTIRSEVWPSQSGGMGHLRTEFSIDFIY